ncbi:serine hydrolase [Corynebacterium halotolerans]|uniref:D-alanyl-D-alanine carboxypeptidase family protein n=1 Tax=Corynebacterium halotolerans TaxID=225326 RepID=UPI003CFAED6E
MKILASAVAATMLLAATPTPEPTPGQEPPDETTTREHAPVTDDCPNAETPPEPKTTSEAEVAPPDPLPTNSTVPCGVIAPAGFEVPAEQTAAAWMVFDIDSGEIIAAKDPHGRYRPASVIKVLLALVALRDLELSEEIMIPADWSGVEGSAVGVGPGGTYTVEQLLLGLLLASGNDAAKVLADQLGGDEHTLAEVNALAEEIGTEDTRVVSYSGLDGAGMSTSAADLALMYRYAWGNEDFTRMVDTEYIDFPGYGDREGYQVWNDNALFMNDPDGIGGKTGYTDDANHTFVGAMDRDGRRLAAVLLDTTIDKGRPWEQAQRFLNAAYAVPVGSGVGSLAVDSDEPEEAGADPAPDVEITEPPRAEDAASGETGSWIFGGIAAAVLVLFGLACIPLLRRRK